MNFEIVLPIEAHARIVYEWRNDPVSLAMSCTYTQKKSFEDFFKDFLLGYFTLPHLPSLFIQLKGKRVGIIRFDPTEKIEDCEISLLLSPDERNKGLGLQILETIETHLIKQNVGKVLARIKKENPASLKVFHRAGYQFIKEEEGILRFEKVFHAKAKKVLIIAEAGSNWHAGGDNFDRIKRLIEAAKESGADIIKFQIFKSKSTYVPDAGQSDYLSFSGIKENISDIFKQLEMPEDWIPKIADHCNLYDIEFLASVFSSHDFELVNPFVKRHKISSYENTYLELISLVAKTGKPVIISTGASEKHDIDVAVQTFWQSWGQDLTLMQCTAKYPAPLETMNLNVLPWLKKRYNCQVGLSDHSQETFVAPIAAVALGATIIEKHFTLDKKLPGPDHAFALNPLELKQLVQLIRETEIALGSSLKEIQPMEKELYYFAKRGIQALQDIKKGEVFHLHKNIDILRPGKKSLGLHPKFTLEIEGKIALQDISQGEGIQKEHYKV